MSPWGTDLPPDASRWLSGGAGHYIRSIVAPRHHASLIFLDLPENAYTLKRGLVCFRPGGQHRIFFSVLSEEYLCCEHANLFPDYALACLRPITSRLTTLNVNPWQFLKSGRQLLMTARLAFDLRYLQSKRYLQRSPHSNNIIVRCQKLRVWFKALAAARQADLTQSDITLYRYVCQHCCLRFPTRFSLNHDFQNSGAAGRRLLAAPRPGAL